MLNGFYAVRFQSPVGMGGGVIFLNDGSIKGGDSTIFYHGTYEESGETFTSDLKIDTHLNLPGHTTVFGIPKADLKISLLTTSSLCILTPQHLPNHQLMVAGGYHLLRRSMQRQTLTTKC